MPRIALATVAAAAFFGNFTVLARDGNRLVNKRQTFQEFAVQDPKKDDKKDAKAGDAKKDAAAKKEPEDVVEKNMSWWKKAWRSIERFFGIGSVSHDQVEELKKKAQEEKHKDDLWIQLELAMKTSEHKVQRAIDAVKQAREVVIDVRSKVEDTDEETLDLATEAQDEVHDAVMATTRLQGASKQALATGSISIVPPKSTTPAPGAKKGAKDAKKADAKAAKK